MTNNFPELLLRLTLASAMAIALVLLLRRPLRARFGAQLAYQAWLLVPLMLAAALLPPLAGVPPPVLVVFDAIPGAAAAPLVAAHIATDWSAALLLAWVCGALLCAFAFVQEHRRFVRRLGQLTVQGALHVSSRSTEGPLLLGLWRPRLVVPADFSRRYCEREQALIVAHEQAHAARRDPAANAVLTLLQCVFWFNPLLHIAAPRFRLDQELACDASVLAAQPGQARAYASAMLKTQLGDAETSASCHWQSNHPLKERMMHLQATPISPSRRLAGRLALCLLVLGGTGATVLARADTAAVVPDKATRYDLAMTLTALGTTSKPHLHVRDGEMFRIGKGNDQQQWDGEFVLSSKGGGKLLLTSKVTLDGKPMGTFSQLTELGMTSTINVDLEDGKRFTLDVVASILPDKPAAK